MKIIKMNNSMVTVLDGKDIKEREGWVECENCGACDRICDNCNVCGTTPEQGN